MHIITESHLYYLLKLLRPRQWMKNLALFAAITFGGQLFHLEVFKEVFIGFLAFCFLSSSTYIFNDIIDVEKDKLHPFKRGRPIACGKISIQEAVVIFFVMLSIAALLTVKVGGLFFLVLLSYIALQISYSLLFKAIVMFDILFIAAGYILRVLAGEVISGYHISVWLLLTVVSLSLFLAVAKRRSELTLLRNFAGSRIEAVRKSLSHYSENLLDAFSTMFATSTFMFYSMFTFLEKPIGVKIPFDFLLPEFLGVDYYFQKKWLMVTILPVVYGLMRYMQDVYEKNEGESPDRVILSDKSLLTSVLIWIFLVIFIIYFVG